MTTNNAVNISSSGIVSYNGSGTFAGRTLTAGSSKLSITNGTGISGNPSVDAVEANFTLNNIGGTLGVAKGGTASTSFNTYGPVVAGATSTTALTSIAPHATTGIAFVSQGAAANPAFGTVVVAGGGTASTSFTTYGPVVAGASSTAALTSIAPHATTGIPFVSQGAAANPAFSTAVVAGGGTGVTSNTAYAVLCGGTSSTGAIQSIASVGTSGQILTSNGAGALPTFQNTHGWEYITTATAADSTSITFTNLSSSYFMYMIVADNIVPATDNTALWMRTSTDNGGSYDAGASDYRFVYNDVEMDTTPTIATVGDDANDEIVLCVACGTGTNERVCMIMNIINPSNATTFTFIEARIVQYDATPQGVLNWNGSIRSSAADVDAIQFLMSSGNIATGTFKLYGLRAT